MRVLPLYVFMFAAVVAPSARGDSHFFLDLGWKVDNVLERIHAPAGYAGAVSSMGGFLRARPSFALASDWRFEPSVGFGVPWRSGADGFTKTIVGFVGMDLAWQWGTWWKWRLGPGLQWNLALSRAGMVELNNGVSTSAFYLPGGVSNSFSWLVDVGVEVLLTDQVSLGWDVWIAEILDGQRRRVHTVVYLGFRL